MPLRRKSNAEKSSRKNPVRKCKAQFKHKDIKIINPSEDVSWRNIPKLNLKKILEKNGQNLEGIIDLHLKILVLIKQI